MKNIAVFGGSFNPPTKAHLSIVNDLSEKFDKVLILPVYAAPHKNNLIEYSHRKKMLQILFKDFINVEVSDLEKEMSIKKFKENKNSCNFTSETINFLRKNDSKNNYIFTFGPDINIKTYFEYEKIGDIYQFENEFEMRSTEFRNLLKEKKYEKAKKMVEDKIWDYIVKYKIYDPNIKVKTKTIAKGYFPLLEAEIFYKLPRPKGRGFP